MFDEIVLRHVQMELREPFLTALGLERTRSFLVVEAHGGGLCGYGEVPVLSTPCYTEETSGTAWHILENYLIPIALGEGWRSPAELAARMSPIKRNGMAKYGLEAAAWDMYARRERKPLASLLGGVRQTIETGVVIGIQDDLDGLVHAVQKQWQAGYRRFKIKIRPGWDEAPVKAIRSEFGDIPLMVDANGVYTYEEAERVFRRLDHFGLTVIEQPLAARNLTGHARLQRMLATPIGLDESIESLEDARQALQLGSCRIICIKPGRVGGIMEAIKIHDLCLEYGVPVWCGGMLESGIGRAHNLALASLPNFCLPVDWSASDRYWQQDLIDPPIKLEPDCTIRIPLGPGIGVQVAHEVLERHTVEKRSFTPRNGK